MVLISRHVVVCLEDETDVYTAREAARSLGTVGGFDRYRLSDIETAVSELCSNALKYGERGWAAFRLDGSTFEATIEDEGPGFEHAARAPGGLGVGLGGAGRLMDTLTIDRRDGRTAVTVSRRRSRAESHSGAWHVRVGWRTKAGSSECGDRWDAVEEAGGLIVAIADGLGSGPQAAAAAGAATGSIRHHPAGSVARMLQRAGAAAAGTRGAVALIARIADPPSTVSYSGVGDVSGTVLPAGSPLVTEAGMLGRPFQTADREVPFGPDSILLLWTDGVRVEGVDGAGLGEDPAGWIEQVLKARGAPTDDGLVLVAGPRAEAAGDAAPGSAS